MTNMIRVQPVRSMMQKGVLGVNARPRNEIMQNIMSNLVVNKCGNDFDSVQYYTRSICDAATI